MCIHDCMYGKRFHPVTQSSPIGCNNNGLNTQSQIVYLSQINCSAFVSIHHSIPRGHSHLCLVDKCKIWLGYTNLSLGNFTVTKPQIEIILAQPVFQNKFGRFISLGFSETIDGQTSCFVLFETSYRQSEQGRKKKRGKYSSSDQIVWHLATHRGQGQRIHAPELTDRPGTG